MTQLHQGVADGGVAVRVELHGVAHNVCHLVIPPVVHALHRVHDAALHGLEAVLNVGYGTLQDYVRGVVQKPVLVHSAQVVHHCCVKSVHRFIVGVAFNDLVVHISFLVIFVLQKYKKYSV